MCCDCALRLETRAAAPDRCANWPYVASGAAFDSALSWASVLMDASALRYSTPEFKPYEKVGTQQKCGHYQPLVADSTAPVTRTD